MSDFNVAISLVLANEGGFVNNPADPGGATNYGISLRWVQSQAKTDPNITTLINGGSKPVDVDDIENMSKDIAITLYRTYWWNPYPYQDINDQGVATMVFDFAVNMGPKKAHVILQKAINQIKTSAQIAIDGILGAQTVSAINKLASPQDLLLAIAQGAIAFYKSLNKPQFQKGWFNRVTHDYNNLKAEGAASLTI